MYILPHDATEHSRLDLQHEALAGVMNGNIHHAPLDALTSPSSFLDVGCGTGVVTVGLGTKYPNAEVYGVDLADVPNIHEEPPNVHYIKGDFLSLAGSPPLNNGEFNYIYSRLLIFGLSDWPKYIGTCARLLRKGGWLEIHELDQTWYRGETTISDGWEWWQATRKEAAESGYDLSCGRNMRQYMKEAGLVDVQVIKYTCPFWIEEGSGDTAEKVLAYYTIKNVPGLVNMAMKRFLAGKVSDDTKTKYEKQMAEDVKEEKGRYWTFYVTFGRAE